jgi:LysM repeat protein
MRTTSKLVCTALLSAAACSLAVVPGVAGVAAAPPTTAPTGAATYTVVAGDTLIGIASRMKVKLQSLLDANAMTVTSLILPGRRLVAPAGAVVPAAAPAKAATTTSPTTGATAAAPAASGGRTTAATTYTIVAGDYLYGIARRFAVPFNSLLTANKLTATSAILPGRQLTIPAGATTTPAAAPTPATPTTTAPATTTTAPKVAKPIAPPKLEIAPTGNTAIDVVLAFAKAQLGKPYVFAAAGPDTYDCSGLTAAAYAQAGLNLIRQSGMQSTQGVPVDFLNAPIVAGDLVFTAGSATPGVISHVGIAINASQWIQATRPGAWVSVGSIPAKSKILAVRRYIA